MELDRIIYVVCVEREKKKQKGIISILFVREQGLVEELGEEIKKK